jgi:hypothetical protein
MYSFLPVSEDRAGAIITLVGLGHERRGYAGRSAYIRRHGIQAGYVRLTTTTRIHVNPPMPIYLPGICCRLGAPKQQNPEAFYLNESDVSIGDFDPFPQDRQDSLY